MAAKPTYWELLRHPNWQKKRLEILKRDEFICRNCGATEKPLHVHHAYYEKGKAPWEYPADSLRTLCEDCHAVTSDVLKSITKQIGSLPGSSYLMQVYGYTSALEALFNLDVVITVLSSDMLCGIANCIGVNPSRVEAALIDRQIDGAKLVDIMAEDR